jgi:hypothetical protein
MHFVQRVLRTNCTTEKRIHQVIQAQGLPETRAWYIEKGFARSYIYDANKHSKAGCQGLI